MKVEQIKQQGEERRKNMEQDAHIKKQVDVVQCLTAAILICKIVFQSF